MFMFPNFPRHALSRDSYRTITPKARLISLSAPFLSYLRADGIVLPPSSPSPSSANTDLDDDSGISLASSDSDSNSEDADAFSEWQEIHQKIKSTITELGGSVVPKLNWSAPKDATWISATNSMECRTPDDVYLLLKSSDFVTHDLEQAFDGCEDDESGAIEGIPYHLVLRKTIHSFITSLEFRCFVRRRKLLCICQRDLNHYTFLPSLVPTLRLLIEAFFEENLKNTFPDESFVFDVYIPQPKEKGRVWLIDINPWAPRTDPLLYSWLEILTLPEPKISTADLLDGVLRLSIQGHNRGLSIQECEIEEPATEDEEDESSESDEEDVDSGPEFRLVNIDDPEAYSFSTPQYSAHKLPKDVVDASADKQSGLREFMSQWRDIVARQEREDSEDSGD